MAQVLLTGAFGNVGEYTLRALVGEGHSVVAFDMRSDATLAKAARLEAELRFRTVWGDLTDSTTTRQVVIDARPDAILHVAAVIAPIAYVRPELAHRVNVDGTRNLIAAAKASGAPRFVFTSSYSVHGPRNPHRDLPPIDGDTPVAPGDNYGRHKVAGEQETRDSGLPWTVIRLPAVASLDPGFGRDPAFMRFGSVIDPDQRRHGCDVRDVALAFAHSVEADVVGKDLVVAGDASWRLVARDHVGAILGARGLPPMPDSAFRRADPQVDASWYYEDWVDTARSQQLLDYQRHTFDDHLDTVRRSAGPSRHLLRLIGPLVMRGLVRNSPFAPSDPTRPDDRTVWEHVCELFDVDPAVQ
jgi:nucleoside-diphosphate-sugar epimerase